MHLRLPDRLEQSYADLRHEHVGGKVPCMCLELLVMHPAIINVYNVGDMHVPGATWSDMHVCA